MPKQLYTESSDDISYLFSNKNDKDDQNDKLDRPNGGFPPILILNNTKDTPNIDTKNRKMETTIRSIRIQDILASKKKIICYKYIIFDIFIQHLI